MAVSQARVEQVVAMHGGSNKAIKVKKALIDSPTGDTEVGTGIILPEFAIVRDVYVKVITTDSGGTLDVGTDSTDSGDADGYLDGLALDNAGLGLGSMASGAVTLGSLLQESGVSSALRISDVASGEKEVTVTHNEGTNATKFELFVEYEEL